MVIDYYYFLVKIDPDQIDWDQENASDHVEHNKYI